MWKSGNTKSKIFYFSIAYLYFDLGRKSRISFTTSSDALFFVSIPVPYFNL